jgi:tetratricopeptide (TPR) repeat protein
VRLRHLGYDPALFVRRAKGERNARLVEAEVREHPDNAYARLKQGEILLGQGRLEEAAASVEEAWRQTWQAVSQGAGPHLLEEPATLRAACAVAEGKYEEALDTLGRFHGVRPATANTSYLEGVCLFALGRPGAGERILAAMEMPAGSGELFTLPEIRGVTPRYVLGSLALGHGDAQEARTWFERSLEIDPEHRESRLGLAEALFLLGLPSRAVPCLAALLEASPTDAQAWRLGGVHLVSALGQEASARAWLEAACTALPDDAILSRLRQDLSLREPVLSR